MITTKTSTQMHTTAQGDQFRDLVADLLKTQFPDAKVEQRLNGTKVDIVFSKFEFGRRACFGVECKDYANPLTKTYIAEKIFPLYEPLLASGSIDRLLIVSKRPLGADASAYVANWRGTSHQTYEELAESLIGLRRYVEGLGKLEPTPDICYIEARIEDKHGTAMEVIDRWVNDSNIAGLSILGSYGQGKTSFAKRVAAEYAKRYLIDPTSRLPILLKLGEVVHETQLEGLFGKEFTARNYAPGYQFQTLEHLNKQGRLIVLLDGFDEMKHAMTSADFQSNFGEFNRLLVGRAKVVLLGRPNALPSDERDLVFRGRARVGGTTVASSTYTPWTEWKLAFFDVAEATTLLRSHLSSLKTQYEAEQRYKYSGNFLEERASEILLKVPTDLLRRPVHVALIAEVGADPDFDLNGFNEFKLYEHFIKSMVARDTVSKAARRSIPLDARLMFQRDLAWWAWRRVGATQGCFFRQEVPQHLYSNLPDGNSIDDEGKRNEYIVSTLTEEKESGILYFAHRSFQEFLVAEYARLQPSTPNIHLDYATFFTADVFAFLRQAGDTEFILDWYETLRTCNGPLNISYLQFYSTFPDLIKQIGNISFDEMPEAMDAWSASILALAALPLAHDAPERESLSNIYVGVIQKGSASSAAIATLAILGNYLESLQPIDLAKLGGALIGRCLTKCRPVPNDTSELVTDKRNVDFSSTWLCTAVQRLHPLAGHSDPMKLTFNLKILEDLCLKQLTDTNRVFTKELLHDNPFSSYAMTPDGSTAEINSEIVYRRLPKDLMTAHKQYLHFRLREFRIVQVEQTKTRAPNIPVQYKYPRPRL